jgi:BirA family biotin operon repressor/biotin-[acetyl-CoA-carboxylase] ligase
MNDKKTAKIQWFDEINSTNDYAKERRADGENLIVIAKRQTGGRGTKGRSFSSREGGVYLTALTFYDALPAKRAFTIMQQAATAVCKTLVFFGLTPKIKWPNDIFVADKKICGILIENTFSGAFVQNSVVGIGINIYNELPDELKDIATSIYQQTGKKIPVEKVAEKLVENLSKDSAREYLSFIGYMDKPARICIGETWLDGILRSVDEDGNLWVELDGEIRPFSSAEITVRI